MRNIKVVISYDGTEFAGWQIQKRDRTVQEEIQKALGDLHGHAVPLTGAGRTDSGVHATGQVGNFFTDMDSIPAGKFRDALNARLPGDVRILSSALVGPDFHSRRDAICRCYEYHLLECSVVPAHLNRHVWLVKPMPSLHILNEMASVLPGTHDFSTFAAAGDANPSRVRTIYQATFLTDGASTKFCISGNAFLWKMVRSLTGTMVDLARRGGDSRAMQGILEAQNRDAAGPTAPARGLFLTKVTYGSDTGIH